MYGRLKATLVATDNYGTVKTYHGTVARMLLLARRCCYPMDGLAHMVSWTITVDRDGTVVAEQG